MHPATVNHSCRASRVAVTDVSYINPFIEQTIHVFDVMLGWKIERQSIAIKSQVAATHDVSGVVTLSGAVAGTIVVSLSRELACRAAAKLLNAEFPCVNQIVADLVGELANTIAGPGASKLSSRAIALSLPSVVVGHSKAITFPEQSTPLVVEFDTPWSPIALEVGLAIDFD